MTIFRKIKDQIEKIVSPPPEDEELDYTAPSLHDSEHLKKIEETLLSKGELLIGGDTAESVSTPTVYSPENPSEAFVPQPLEEVEEEPQKELEGDLFSAPSHEEMELGLFPQEARVSRMGEDAVLEPEEIFLSEEKGLSVEQSKAKDDIYTHGFQEIYSLEKVDSRSIKKVSKGTDPQEKERAEKKGLGKYPVEDEQLLFDFGLGFRQWMESLRLKEPIQVLNLSQQTVKALLQSDKRVLRDVFTFEASDFRKIKGLGQGHIDELQQSLCSYLSGYDLFCVKRIDFSSLIRCLMGPMDKALAFSLLSSYGLSDLFALSPSESATYRHWSWEKQQACRQEALEELKSENRRNFLRDVLKEVTHSFVQPWMLKRFGLCSHHDIIERLSGLSFDRATTEAALNFISDVYYNGKFLLMDSLIEVDPYLYAANRFVADSYKDLKARARTYFYKRGSTYSLYEIKSFLSREYARDWKGLEEDFIERVLRQSPSFRVRKGVDGRMFCKIA